MRDGGVRHMLLRIWKANMLLPGRDWDAHFAPTIVMRQEGGVLQREGVSIY